VVNGVFYSLTLQKSGIKFSFKVVLVNLVVFTASFVAVEVSADSLNRRNQMTLYVIKIYRTATEIFTDHHPPIAPDAFNITCSTISSNK